MLSSDIHRTNFTRNFLKGKRSGCHCWLKLASYYLRISPWKIGDPDSLTHAVISERIFPG